MVSNEEGKGEVHCDIKYATQCTIHQLINSRQQVSFTGSENPKKQVDI